MTTTDVATGAAPVAARGHPRRPASPADWAIAAIVTVDVVVGIYYRFTTSSKLWLDEAQTVNISSGPLRGLVTGLKRDGAPPLYYALLHVWMGIAGHSDAAVRSLSGIFAVATLPVMWWVVRRYFGATEAAAALAVLASSPFAVYFATESRMYALVMLLVTAGIGAVIALLDRATVPRALGVFALGALLLYTHYWSLYLLGVVGLWLCVVVVRGGPRRRGAAYGIAALVGSVIAFLPWMPVFLYQRAHTGTPWALPASLAAAYGWLAGFTSNQSVQQQALSLHAEFGLLFFVILLVFGFAGRPDPPLGVDLRLTGMPRARALSFVAVGTLAVGWLASRASDTAFQPRYSSVVFPVLVVLVALGVATLPTRWLQAGVLAVVSVLALWAVHWGATVQRSEAGVVSGALHAHVAPKTLVVVCPDQLGPSLLRYSGRSTYRYVGYPRFTSPWLVNWVDYKAAVNAMDPQEFAQRVVAAAGPRPFYLVWSKGYGFLLTCQDLAGELSAASGRAATSLVIAHKYAYYQSMNLYAYLPQPGVASR